MLLNFANLVSMLRTTSKFTTSITIEAPTVHMIVLPGARP